MNSSKRLDLVILLLTSVGGTSIVFLHPTSTARIRTFRYQVTVPILDPSKELYPGTSDLSKTIFGTGDVKTALTDRQDVGRFVARIIADDRTLNRYVFCWGEERSQKEIIALAERVAGKPIPTKQLPAEQVEAIASAQAPGSLEQSYFQYFYSLFVRGDNTIQNAKREEYGSALDAKELYPDLEPRSLEDFANDFYAQ